MANVNTRLQVRVVLDALPVSRAGFTTPLIVDPDATFAEMLRFYTNTQDLEDDLSANLIGQAAADMALNGFGQTPRPARIGIGRLTGTVSGGTHVIAFDSGIPLTPGDLFQFEIQSIATSALTPTLGESLGDFLVRLRDAINSTAGTNSIDVTASIDGDDIELVWGVGEVASLVDVSALSDPNQTSISFSGGTPSGGGMSDLLAASGDWYGFAYPATIEAEPALHASFAAWAEANSRLFGAITADSSFLTLGLSPFQGSPFETYENTFLMYRAEPDPSEAYQHPAFALMANRLSVNPDESSTIWSYVQLAGQPSQTQLSGSELEALRSHNVNVASMFFGNQATAWGVQLTGRKTDLVVLKHWLEARVGEAIAQLQLDRVARGSKIPYDDTGLTMIREQVESILATGINVGHLVDNSTNVNMPTYAQIPLADRANRWLSFTFEGAPTGAIEDMSIVGTVSVSAGVFA